MKISKKAQNPSYAVPIILMATIALFLFYLIMLYPWERAELLMDETNESPLGPGTEILYSSGEVIEVGSSAAGTLSKFIMNDVFVSYPAVPVVVDSSATGGISANIFTSDTIVLRANNVDTSNVKGLLLSLNITAVGGTPKLVVILNETTIYTSPAVVGAIDISISAEKLGINNPVYVKLYHTGWFWEVQSIKLESVKLNRVEYQTNKISQSQIIPLTTSNYQGNTLKIVFTPSSANIDGALSININGKQVWSGRPVANAEATASINLDQSNIKIGENTIEFVAEKGGEYNLTKVSLQFASEAAPAAKKVYSFNLEHDKLFAGRPIKVGVKIDRVVDPGTLYVKVVPYDVAYYFSQAQLNPGVWVYANLDKSKLKELGNQLELNSLDGRFKVSGFMIVLS